MGISTVERNALENKWIYDSSATRHIENSIKHMTDLNRTDGLVEIGNRTTVHSLNVGTLVSNLTVDGVTKTVEIQNVSYVPGLTTNLLSVRFLQRNAWRWYARLEQMV